MSEERIDEQKQEQKPQVIKPMRGRGMPVPKGAIKKGTFSRLIKTAFKYFKPHLIFALVCIFINSFGSIIASVFMQSLVDKVITPGLSLGYDAVKDTLIGLITMMACGYGVIIIASFFYNRTMAKVTQGMLYYLRTDMFKKMQTLPIKYFDTHAHGEIMSTYTNDTDATRQLIGQSLPTLISSSLTLIVSIFLMLYYSLWLTFVVAICTFAMTFVVKKIGGRSAKYMVAQQRSLAIEEGFVEEMMKGQKVVKVFTHEEKAKADFNKYNDQLYQDSSRAHIFGNILGPILGNIGNFNYVLLAIIGGLLYTLGAPNLGLSSIGTGLQTITIGVIIAFLGMSRNFTMIINQMSQQISMIAMGLAGASRVFTLMDEQSEQDEGYVSLVNARQNEDGSLVETQEHTGLWAWKHYH